MSQADLYLSGNFEKESVQFVDTHVLHRRDYPAANTTSNGNREIFNTENRNSNGERDYFLHNKNSASSVARAHELSPQKTFSGKERNVRAIVEIDQPALEENSRKALKSKNYERKVTKSKQLIHEPKKTISSQEVSGELTHVCITFVCMLLTYLHIGSNDTRR